jgi:type I restriction enzyme S subunit
MSELYTLPDGWEWKKTIEKFLITDYVANGSFASLRENVEYKDEKDYAILVRLTDYSNGWNGNYKYVTKKSYDFLSKSALKEDDILICNVGATIGTTFKVPELGQPMTLAPNSILIRPLDESTENQYAFYYFKSNIFQTKISNIATTTAQPKFNKTDFRSQYIPLPTLEEQKRIVSKLDILFAKIDKAIALHQKNIDEANVFMASVLNDVFVELEEKYKVVKISDIAHIKGGKRLPKGEKLSEKQTQYPYIRVADFLDIGTVNLETIQYITEDIYKQIRNYIITSNDLYISIAGTIGKTGIIPKELDGANLTENAAKLVYKIEDISNKYVYFLTKSSKFEEQIGLATKTVAQPKLALTRLSEVELPLPPLKTQQKVVSYLDEISSKMEKIKQIQKEKMESIKALKASILDQAFRGEL